MSWIAISDADSQHFSLSGLEPAPKARVERAAPLSRGSLVVETRLSPEGRPQTLLEYRVRRPQKRSLSLQALPNGGIVFVMQEGRETAHTVIPLDITERADLLRITYSWDCEKSWARLAVERPETGWVKTEEITSLIPLWSDDIQAITLARELRLVDQDVEFFAVSDAIEPLGPMPSLAGWVPIICDGRYKALSDIRPGEHVETIEHGPVRVMGKLARTVPARGSYRPVRLRAPYFGLQRDIVVAPDQKLVISQPMVEYMFGCEAVLVPARHLVNGTSAIWSDSYLTKTYHQLILPDHETIIAAGSSLESLFLGRLRRKPERHAASLLASVPRERLPEHLLSAHPVLRPFEAITLVEQTAA